MENKLFIEVKFDKNKFLAEDKSPYERWVNDGYLDDQQSHAVFNRLVKVVDDENELIASSINVISTISELSSTWEVPDLKNNLYFYQKMLLPTQESVSDTALWYNQQTEKVNYKSSGQTLVLDPSEDFDQIYSLVKTLNLNNCFYFDSYSLTIYDLINCYIMIVKDIINNYFKNNCKENCVNNTDIQQRADILLAAIMVINDLIEKKDFFEAQRILNGLSTCGHLCDDYNSESKNNCNCGKA